MHAQVPTALQGALPPVPMPIWDAHTSQLEYVPLMQQRCQKAVNMLAAALPLQVQVRKTYVLPFCVHELVCSL